MEGEALTGLIEYGVLGLWTISLLWSQRTQEARHQKQIERMEERHDEQTKDFLNMREKIHGEIVEELQQMTQSHQGWLIKLDVSLAKVTESCDKVTASCEKISDGLATMREKHAEDRMMMLQAIPKPEK